jgi:hypothetical protein
MKIIKFSKVKQMTHQFTKSHSSLLIPTLLLKSLFRKLFLRKFQGMEEPGNLALNNQPLGRSINFNGSE